ncbi:hypothetical protein [Streptomyces sp. NPDC004296]|uniref:hypothetical protein n=1 Tax=Streptomyces sp. NPDC004296 TaxID=3364697 RepID=UPI00367D3375
MSTAGFAGLADCSSVEAIQVTANAFQCIRVQDAPREVAEGDSVRTTGKRLCGLPIGAHCSDRPAARSR